MIRSSLLRQSDAYPSARKLPKGKAKTTAFSEIRKAYRYSEYDLHSYAQLAAERSHWITEKLDVNTQQTIATRAFEATERVLFGKAKKVRYKVPSRFRSMEGKTNKQGIRWKANQFVWGSLVIPADIDWSDPVILHGLASPIKYVRILHRELNGKRAIASTKICLSKWLNEPQ